MLEFFLAWAGSIRESLQLICFFLGFAAGVSAFGWLMIDDFSSDSKLAPTCKKLSLWFLVTLFFCSFPTIDDLWKVRIALIKYRLASPENVQKGADEIASIAHKLECRYLGCKDEHK